VKGIKGGGRGESLEKGRDSCYLLLLQAAKRTHAADAAYMSLFGATPLIDIICDAAVTAKIR